MEAGVVIAGAGHAGGEFALKLRHAGYAGPITMVGAEDHPPYQRPPLSKGFLSGDIEISALLLRPAAVYAKNNVEFASGTKVESIVRTGKTVKLSGGGELVYDKLVLATGGHARKLPVPGAELNGLFYLRTIDDVDAIRAHIQPGKKLVIIGGGYIGLEVAAVAVKSGLRVTLIEAAPRLLARVAGMEISAFYEKAHRDAGVEIYTGVGVQSIAGAAENPGQAGGVVLSDGRLIAADFILAGVGLIPNTELAEAAGLHVSNGIWVDEYCRTEDHDILAIGDCSNHPSGFLGRRVRLESVPNALEQGRVAADTICGKLAPYNAVPWFWSDQYDLKLQSVGLSEGHDRVVIRGIMDARAFTVFYLRDGVVISADAVNRPGEFMLAKKIVAGFMKPDASKLGDPEVPLKELFA